MPDGNTIRSVAKAMELLQILSDSGALTLLEIAERSGFPKSTVFGLLTTMREYNVVAQTDDGKYTLGMRLFEFGCNIGRARDISKLARPYLELLAARTEAAAVITILDGDSAITLDQVEGNGNLRVVSNVGGRLPLHCSSQGKIFLAAMNRASLLSFLDEHPLTAYTPHTIVTPERLTEELEAVRRQGYAIVDGEYKIGLRSVSAPVRDADGRVKYAIGLLGMFRNTRSEEFRAAIEEVCSAGRMLTSALCAR